MNPRFLDEQREFILGLFGIIFFLLLWQLTTFLRIIDLFFISSPLQVANELFLFFASGFIFPHLAVSLIEFFIGFILAFISAVILGLVIGWYKKIYAFSNIFIYALYSTPFIALMPLVIIWTGLGIWPKILIVFLGSFFPIFINTMDSVKTLNSEYIKLARSFGASDLQLFRYVIFPASVNGVITGVKLAIPRGIIGMLVGEFFISSKGLGYLITFYGSTFQTGKLLAIIVVVISISTFFVKMTTFLKNISFIAKS